MCTPLSRDFVESKIKPVGAVPQCWQMRSLGPHYSLDLRMCLISSVHFAFDWQTQTNATDQPLPSQYPPSGANKLLPLVDQPAIILSVDLSLNDISFVNCKELRALVNCKSLNVSLNRITSLSDLEVLRFLVQLNVAYNYLENFQFLPTSLALVELSINHNLLTDLHSLPILTHLQFLNINSNKIRDLNGIQKLPALKELLARQNEISSLEPLTPCRKLAVLDLMGNKISQLESLIQNCQLLEHLRDLTLLGNPVYADPIYKNSIKANLTLFTLDGVPIDEVSKMIKLQSGDKYDDAGAPLNDIEVFRLMAKKTYAERIKQSRMTMENTVQHYQQRILSIIDEQKNLEKKLQIEMHSTLNHIDYLDRQTAENFRLNRLPIEFDANYLPKKSDLSETRNQTQSNETDEVLKNAAVKLQREKQRQLKIPSPFQIDPEKVHQSPFPYLPGEYFS